MLCVSKIVSLRLTSSALAGGLMLNYASDGRKVYIEQDLGQGHDFRRTKP